MHQVGSLGIRTKGCPIRRVDRRLHGPEKLSRLGGGVESTHGERQRPRLVLTESPEQFLDIDGDRHEPKARRALVHFARHRQTSHSSPKRASPTQVQHWQDRHVGPESLRGRRGAQQAHGNSEQTGEWLALVVTVVLPFPGAQVSGWQGAPAAQGRRWGGLRVSRKASTGMDGWQHTTRDYDRATDGDEEAWARAVALEGWHDLAPVRGVAHGGQPARASVGAAPAVLAPVVGSRAC